MELTDKEKAIIVDLAGIAWKAGAVRGPQQAQEIQNLVAKVAAPKPGKKKDKKDG